jgi:putative methionine-R-sulfoxide reductase with GAF domain
MNRFSILSRKPAPVADPVSIASDYVEPVTPAPREALRFPGNDGGKSLAEMAQQDLEAALQLLAERAQYITGASGAAIALRNGTEIICRASAGPSAPELGAHLQINSGLSGESMRTRQILRCDDAETDTRVNRESCRALGISSVVVMPLVNEDEVNGVFELFSGRPNAFEERDIAALQRLAEMIQIAVQHSEAAKRTQKELATEPQSNLAESLAPAEDNAAEPKPLIESVEPPSAPPTAVQKLADEPELAPIQEIPVVLTSEPLSSPQIKISKCEACGFPVSEGRTLCLDCEANHEATPKEDFLSQFPTEESWISSHKYLLGIVLVVLATILVLLRFR